MKIWKVLCALLVAIALLVAPADTGLAWTLISHVKLTPAGGSGGTTAAISTVGADLIIVEATQGAGTTPTLSDSASNTWSCIATLGGSFASNKICYVHNPTTSASHTFTYSGAFNESISVAAFSGSAVGTVLDQSSGGSSGTTTVQPGSVTPTQSGELLITGLSIAGASGAAVTGVDSGFTITDTLPFSSGNYYGNGMAYFFQSTAAAVNPTWTLSATPSQLLSQIATFKGAAVAAPTRHRLIRNFFPANDNLEAANDELPGKLLLGASP